MSLKQWKHTNGYEPYETLPEVNSEDNGKVLGVADGAYALVSGGGGGGSAEPLIVNSTETGIDATYNEIKAAVLAGKAVWLYLDDSEYSNVLYKSLVALGIDTGYYFCAFSNGYTTSSYGSEDADTDMSSPDDVPIDEH